MTVLSVLTKRGRLQFARYRFILSTLASHGFGEIVYQTGVGKLLKPFGRVFGRKRPAAGEHVGRLPTWARVRLALEELGPTFIKLGQILSNRPDLIPKELQQELVRLQENVLPFSSDEAVAAVEASLGAPVEELFAEFERKPLAAASIAQVHRGRLVTGEDVAVKVQRPGLRELVRVDVAILRELAGLVERYVPESRKVGPSDIVDEFERAILQELDFGREAAAIDRFAAQFSDEKRIKIPKVYRSHLGKRVLTMEYIEGTPMSAFLNDESLDAHEATTIAELGADLTLKQIFVHGFFHADPHPGNILVLEDGRICYLDFGLTGNLIQRDLEVVSDILINIISRNEQKAARAVVQLAGSRDFERAKNIEREIAELIDRFQSSEAGDFSFTALLSDLIGVLVDEGLTLPPDLFLLVKSLITIEGVATGLDSTFNFTAHLEPFAETLLKERFGPKRIKARLATVAGDYSEMLEGLPGDYYRVVETLASGRVRFSLEDPSVRSLQSTVLRASSALVSAIVVGALIIGSALIVHSGVPPLWNGVPVIGIVGFLVAGLVGFGLLVSTLRKSGG